MGEIDDMLEDDAGEFLDAFGELITVTDAPGGTAREISAIVDRMIPDGIPGATPQNASPRIEIEIKRHATLGILVVDRGALSFSVADIRGGTARARSVAAVVHEDAGMIRLLLR